MSNPVDIIILAAGGGSRLNSTIPKALFPVLEKPMVTYLVDAISNLEIETRINIIVLSKDEEAIKTVLNNYKCRYYINDKKQGTADSLNTFLINESEMSDNIIVLHVDNPLIKSKSISNLYKSHSESNAKITFLTTIVSSFEREYEAFKCFGRVLRNSNNKIEEIIEYNDSSDTQKLVREVNPAIYAFNTNWIKDNINKIQVNEKKNEYYLTDIASIAKKENIDINSFLIDPQECFGINTQEELKIVEKLLKSTGYKSF